MFNEKRLPLLIFILPIAALILILFMFLYIYTVQQKRIMNDNLAYIEQSYKQHIIKTQKIKIDSELDILVYNCKNVETTLKPQLKRMVDTAYDIITNIYENNKDLPKKKLFKL